MKDLDENIQNNAIIFSSKPKFIKLVVILQHWRNLGREAVHYRSMISDISDTKLEAHCKLCKSDEDLSVLSINARSLRSSPCTISSSDSESGWPASFPTKMTGGGSMKATRCSLLFAEIALVSKKSESIWMLANSCTRLTRIPGKNWRDSSKKEEIKNLKSSFGISSRMTSLDLSEES